ncbi:phage GP46 family protein [Micavibrio aeruginosavorus]|uniref:phage GP46 family protein n=1 Tax=Micavibrio aeruginosavorus TaxID=349221 RepID=UPI003F4AB417
MKLVVTESGMIDLGAGEGGLLKEDSLTTAVIISLMTDRRAEPDDRLPEDDGRTRAIPLDRRGWAGDALATDSRRIGSRLWLLVREKQTEETRRRAIEYAREALQWTIDDGIASRITITAEWGQIGRLNMQIVIYLIDGAVFSTTVNDVLKGDAYAV